MNNVWLKKQTILSKIQKEKLYAFLELYVLSNNLLSFLNQLDESEKKDIIVNDLKYLLSNTKDLINAENLFKSTNILEDLSNECQSILNNLQTLKIKSAGIYCLLLLNTLETYRFNNEEALKFKNITENNLLPLYSEEIECILKLGNNSNREFKQRFNYRINKVIKNKLKEYNIKL